MTDDAGRAAAFRTPSERVTADVAVMLGRLVRALLDGSSDPERDRDRFTRFVLECVVAMFAEDTELIPPRLFTYAMREADAIGKMDPVWSLFADFGRKNPSDRGGLYAPFVDGPFFGRDHRKVDLTPSQIHDLYSVARDFDWRDVRLEIFGSIFEQALDLSERHELGAHFTREADIARVIGPTIIEPWRQRIASIRMPQDAEHIVAQMREFHVLDPACGCGNFLYVVYREMKRLEAALIDKWVSIRRARAKQMRNIRPPPPRPYFTLDQVHGIEKNAFGAFLARVVLWIGEHLSARELGLPEETLPRKNLDATIRHADALIVDWPRPEGELAIVGNPPYLGVRKMRRELGDAYVEELFERYPENRAADYVTYWFTRALDVLRPGERAGYVCTNSVAQNESREASIDRIIAKGGTITDAWKSYPWAGEAAVHIGIVNWVMASYEGIKMLDGREAMSISPSLTEAVDVTSARPIAGNENICFMGVTPGNNEFVLSDEQRAEILARDPASEAVIFPFLVGRDVNREIDQQPTRWIIDFGMMTQEEAEEFRGAMSYVRKHVYPVRSQNRRESYAKHWWRFVEPRRGLREAIRRLKHVLVIPCVSPHILVSRQRASICFDHQLMVVTLQDYYHFGILQSRLHEIWARARGSTLKGDLRYTNTTIFETFPFPLQRWGNYDAHTPPSTDKATRVATLAQAFDKLRTTTCKEHGLGLTKIHNQLKAGELPELQRAYDALNEAVATCYGFPQGVFQDEKETLRRLLQRNHEVATPAPSAPG
ncbi:MAG: class I SAM-dependent DNA methyltransferase [Polyangiaceae bacterium]|nr:class I SAM-dependent DNA methyltransferase [Polyangiaceae bacterium]